MAVLFPFANVGRISPIITHCADCVELFMRTYIEQTTRCWPASFLRAFLLPTLLNVYRYFPFSPIALKHRERQRGCALRHGGLLLHYRP